MESNKIKEIVETYRQIFDYMFGKLCDNRVVDAGWNYIQCNVLEDPANIIMRLKGIFSQEVFIYFIFEKAVTDFMSDVIQEVLYEQLGLIIGSTLETDQFIEKWKEELFESVIKRFKYHMKHKFFLDLDDITAISSMYYESAEANGNLYLILDDSEIKPLKNSGDFHQKITLCKTDLRKIRKNLEITYDATELEQEYPTGLAFVYKEAWTFQGILEELSNNSQYLRFHFVKHMVWELYGRQGLIIRYNCGAYDRPIENNKEELKNKISEIMPDCTEEAKMWDAVDAALKQRHGTILVILKNDCGEREANRLVTHSTGTRVTMQTFSKTMIERLTSVDGALLMDCSGNLLAYGVILDTNGKNVEVTKDPGRGSRFHSAKKYIKSLSVDGKVALAVIISEDGMVNYYSTKDAERESTDGT